MRESLNPDSAKFARTHCCKDAQMLILTRQVGTAIVIGQQIVVKVVHIDGDKVRLGIEAPKELQVQKETVSEKVKR